MENLPEGTNTSFIPPVARIERKAARLRTLLDLGGTLENKGGTLHVSGLRIDVSGLADMDKSVWSEVRRNIEELTSVDLEKRPSGGELSPL